MTDKIEWTRPTPAEVQAARQPGVSAFTTRVRLTREREREYIQKWISAHLTPTQGGRVPVGDIVEAICADAGPTWTVDRGWFGKHFVALGVPTRRVRRGGIWDQDVIGYTWTTQPE